MKAREVVIKITDSNGRVHEVTGIDVEMQYSFLVDHEPVDMITNNPAVAFLEGKPIQLEFSGKGQFAPPSVIDYRNEIDYPYCEPATCWHEPRCRFRA